MGLLVLDCELSTHSRAALEDLAKSDWQSAEFFGSNANTTGRVVRSNTVRIESSGREFEIGAMSIDIAHKWEVFVLHAEVLRDRSGGVSKAASSLREEHHASADEILEAFLGRNHTLFIVSRQYTVPTPHAAAYTRMMVEDALLIKDRSGQQALIAVDEQNPGGVVVSRVREDIDLVLSDASVIRPV